MKDSTSHSPDMFPVDHQLCCQKKCINCFELGGCVYEQSPVASVHPMAETSPVRKINNVAPIPQRA